LIARLHGVSSKANVHQAWQKDLAISVAPEAQVLEARLSEQVDAGVHLDAAQQQRLTCRPERQNQPPVLAAEATVTCPVGHDIQFVAARLEGGRYALIQGCTTLGEDAIRPLGIGFGVGGQPFPDVIRLRAPKRMHLKRLLGVARVQDPTPAEELIK
jgi:hypothetical protein